MNEPPHSGRSTSITAALSKIQRRMLGLLEEAAEESAPVLINMIPEVTGSSQQIDSIAQELIRLVNLNMVELALVRDRSTLDWVPVAADEARPLLKRLSSLLRWDTTRQNWKWDARSPEIQVLLTPLGQRASHEVLTQDGWAP